jgi:hypothetical protein
MRLPAASRAALRAVVAIALQTKHFPQNGMTDGSALTAR